MSLYIYEQVTVAIPVFNGERYIEDALNSIVNQNIKINKIFISDDCSEDNTISIVERFFIANPEVRYCINRNLRNLGYQENWNICLKSCNSKFLVILHYDDILLKDSLAKQLNFFECNPDLAIVGGKEDLIDAKGNRVKKIENIRDKIYKNGEILSFIKDTSSYIPCSSVMFNMELINEIGYFNTKYKAADELFWPKVLSKYNIAIIGESLINRRIHEKQTELTDFILNYKEIIQSGKAQLLIADYETNYSNKIKIKYILRKKFANNCICISKIIYKKNKSINLPLIYLLSAIRFYPQIIFCAFLQILIGRPVIFFTTKFYGINNKG